jgi:hypothetical protein
MIPLPHSFLESLCCIPCLQVEECLLRKDDGQELVGGLVYFHRQKVLEQYPHLGNVLKGDYILTEERWYVWPESVIGKSRLSASTLVDFRVPSLPTALYCSRFGFTSECSG